MMKTMLIKVDSNANNNKFYEVILQDDGTVHKRWGRVGVPGTSAVENTGERGYNRIVASKKRRGYEETAVVDSGGTQGKIDQGELGSLARQALLKDPSVNDPRIMTLIDRLVAQNQHQIVKASGGMIEVDDSGVLKTPLGIIDKSSVAQARNILDKIAKIKNDESSQYVKLLEEYLTLVPQKVAARRGWHKGFFADDKMQKQIDFLEQLEQSYEWYESTRKAAESKPKDKKVAAPADDLFRYKIELLNDTKKAKQIAEMFNSSANSFHGNRVNKAKIKNIYVLTENAGEKTFQDNCDSMGNMQTYWHGSRVYNVLSILSKGLLTPKNLATARTAGSMFGKGLYFSEQSTKSALYSAGGVWSQGQDNTWYMFVADVVMGNQYTAGMGYRGESHYNKILNGTSKDSKGNRYNSVNVGADRGGVRNHEAIVPGPEQVALRYLVEFEN